MEHRKPPMRGKKNYDEHKGKKRCGTIFVFVLRDEKEERDIGNKGVGKQGRIPV